MLDLVRSFDAAIAQWERLLRLPEGTLDQWHVRAYVMDQPDRFRASGDLPESLQFQYGYAMPGIIWVRAQPSQYYTRHLLLHEGVHALVIDQFGGTGPSWFSEGVAELLSVHRGQNDAIEVGTVPSSKNEVPYWGRFKLLSQAREEAKIPNLSSVLRLPNRLDGDVESYGWCWLLGSLLKHYPEYETVWLKAARQGSDTNESFTQSFRKALASQWPILNARWRMLTETADYGFDWSREKIDISVSDPIYHDDDLQLSVAADQGWQSSKVRFKPGTVLVVSGSGRCSVNQTPKPWISEPEGVTIHYANDRPLGQLLMCVLPNVTKDTPLASPLTVVAVGSQTQLRIEEHCWLLFRINDELGDLANNRGDYKVNIRTAP
ncbi:hypothetical protein LOC67_16715 [Stieleria sp. JC731]|uniref:hypothetical protein n=1 Tax=Pirellulaceae TaxID=2691357 RepID=UPI001E2A1C66|nr:hypothetical protein [Stieleria sp. JC731]MCC9602200.1 hypothetical protein [Stieleria sp. JC731]